MLMTNVSYYYTIGSAPMNKSVLIGDKHTSFKPQGTNYNELAYYSTGRSLLYFTKVLINLIIK